MRSRPWFGCSSGWNEPITSLQDGEHPVCHQAERYRLAVEQLPACRRLDRVSDRVPQVEEGPLAAELSANARRYVAENFSPDVLRRKWSAVLAELAR